MQVRLMTLIFFMLICMPSMTWASSLLICGGAQVIEADVYNSGGKPALREVWHWRPEKSEGLPASIMRRFITTDDCKPVDGGKEILITSSGDAVALVSRETGKTLFYAKVKNAHSAELLPGGWIAVASSDDPLEHKGDRLLLFDRDRPDKVKGYLRLEAAHGVVWDKKRKVLWALGDRVLLRLRLNVAGGNAYFTVEKSVSLPEHIGHDLQIASDFSALYVSTTKTVYVVDPDRLTFQRYAPFNGLSAIKSLSINPESGQIVYTQADPGVWWTYTLRFMNPAQEIALPSMIYKARWFPQ